MRGFGLDAEDSHGRRGFCGYVEGPAGVPGCRYAGRKAPQAGTGSSE
jgi:hypothetical protein